ncbi:MAG: V-type H(+)-translocating pyrophosphatase [Dehalococcoidia bacterium]|uniref:V-type H(+)-translocating pyrophosphatase n=1 Tax=Candidatus Amarobacter glycogenicus TaxID=3140699 RepID=UPI003134C553|nr:V-type H(+)-translocating pyrophosphatase [Dehalococcoidia bacterium]
MLLAQIMIPAASAAAVLFAIWLAFDVLKRDKGTASMQEIAGTILEGANAFLNRQYRTIGIMAVVTSVVVAAIVGIFKDSVEVGVLTGAAFIVGALASGVSGYIGMSIAVRANGRTAAAANNSLADAINTALRGGAVSGFLVVALSLIGVSSMFAIYSRVLGHTIDETPFLIVGFGFGASFVALFAQLGGGIYTKAADVGADLVGKVEAGIPEDDPRNAAVVADLVGDNVGDCAGRGADLFESMSAENIGAMILGVAIFTATNRVEWIMFPLVLRSFGVFATIIGMMTVPFWAKRISDPMGALNGGYWTITVLSIIGLGVCTKVMLEDVWYWFFFCGLVGIATGIAFVYITQYYTAGAWRPVQEIARASRTGSATNMIIGTAVGFETTAVTAITVGLALVGSFVLGSQADIENVNSVSVGVFGTACATMGMLMSAAYVLAMDTFGPITDNAGGINEMATDSKPEAREITDKLDTVGNTTKALTKGYAVGSAALAAFLLFTAFLDEVRLEFGKIAGKDPERYAELVQDLGIIFDGDDVKAAAANAIKDHVETLEAVRSEVNDDDKLNEITIDTLAVADQQERDAIVGKKVDDGDLTADQAAALSASPIPLPRVMPINLGKVEVFVGALLGVMLAFLFSSLAIRAVGKTAGSIIEEVRRQFRESPGIMTGEVRPDYTRAVDITTSAALREMVMPGILAVGLPIATGVIFRYAFGGDGNEGWLAVAGMLMVGTIGGVLLATYLNNAGGAWDNAKKFIESGGLKDEDGNVIGKGSETHAAAVVGDTVGDPFKDTAGPALHVLVKLLSTITLVLAPLFIS